MRRHRANLETARVNLFPFLDVLLCLLGTLVVLLIVVVQHAHLDAGEWAKFVARTAGRSSSAPPQPNANPHRPAADIAAESATAVADGATARKSGMAPSIEAQVAQLSTVRQGVAGQLQEKRNALAFIEDHTRQLQRRLAELEAAVVERQRLAEADESSRAEADAALQKLRARVAEAERNLDQLRREQANRPPLYAIVPYEGPSLTHRRPIYIECQSDRVLLQPEGIVLAEEDFLGPLDSANPLAATLRATCEYLKQQRHLAPDEEPYPLLLVRPNGAQAFYMVRKALESFGPDFGYELVEQDWPLKFPTADPNLALLQTRTLEEARVRQRVLVAAMKRQVKRSRKYRAAPGGGVEADPGAVAGGGAGLPYDDNDGSDEDGPVGNGWGTGGVGSKSPPGGDGGGTHSSVTGGVATNDVATNGSGNRGHARGTGFDARDARDGTYPVADEDGGIHHSAGPRGEGNADRRTAAVGRPTGDRSAAGNRDVGERGPSEFRPSWIERGGTADRGASAAASSAASANVGPMTQNAADRDGQRDSANVPVGESGGHSSAAAAASGNTSTSGAIRDNVADVRNAAANRPTTLADSLAKSRGKNWGLRNADRTSVAITRPVTVACYADRFVVVSPDTGRDAQILLRKETRESVDELLAVVWDTTKSWGIAGKGMYWRPVLSVIVHPDGQRRYDDLVNLMLGSGLEVRKRYADQGPRANANR